MQMLSRLHFANASRISGARNAVKRSVGPVEPTQSTCGDSTDLGIFRCMAQSLQTYQPEC